MRSLITTMGWLLLFSVLQGQMPGQAWHHADPSAGEVMGMGTEKALQQLKGRKSRTVVVAIIDTGVDIDHEDLKENIWVNEDEIPDNGVDDDQNGYIDDLHGWNFLGNSKGENLVFETLEVTRLYRTYAQRFVGVEDIDITDAERNDYRFYLQIKKEYGEKLEQAQREWSQLEGIYKNYQSAVLILRQHLGKNDFSLEEVKALKTKDEVLKIARDFYLEIFASGFNAEVFEEMVEQTSRQLDYHLNPRFNPRPELIGDDPTLRSDMVYGNPDVSDDAARHGTHVAGVIAAVRDNGIGIDGIAPDVRLMVLRAVPDGDERDKDIANAILYAVANGAHIINMSFGKTHSPQKRWVDEAVRFAEERGVLLVQGAGNEGRDNDLFPQYPSPYLNGFSEPVHNWVVTGASSRERNLNLVPGFSNYGFQQVDLFAPGVDIYAPLPDDAYGLESGTSMACPMVTGVAALIWSYYPELSAEVLRKILMQSALGSKKWKVYLPGPEAQKARKKTRFWKLSASGGVLNAYEAVRMAEEYVGRKEP